MLGRMLYDMTQLLESGDGARERVRRVLELLRGLVLYDRCALLEVRLGYEPRFVVIPEVLPEERLSLTDTLLQLFAELVEREARPGAPAERPEGGHLAVPLLAVDEVIGLLFVRSATQPYTEEHVRALSVVAAKLAAYFAMVRAGVEFGDLARERDHARRAAEAASHIKDQFLTLVAEQLRAPLGAVLECTDILRSTTADAAERTRAVDELERNVQLQVKLVDDILVMGSGGSANLRLDLSVSQPELRPTDPSAASNFLTGVRVLVVDHDLEIRESFQSVLEQYGAEVTTAASATEALAAFDRSRPDVLLFGDLATQGDSTYDLIREVTARSSPLPIVSISAWRLDESERALAAGVRLHLIKPLDIGVLVDTVARLAGRTPGNGSRAAGSRSR